MQDGLASMVSFRTLVPKLAIKSAGIIKKVLVEFCRIYLLSGNGGEVNESQKNYFIGINRSISRFPN